MALSYQKEVRGILRLGIIPTIGPFLLPAFTGALAQEHKGLIVEISEDKTETLIEALDKGRIDAAILSTPRKAPDLDQKNAKGYSALMLAAYHGHLEATRYLISIGAEVNSTDSAGSSILIGVAFKGHKEILQLLLEHPSHKNHAGQDVLQFA